MTPLQSLSHRHQRHFILTWSLGRLRTNGWHQTKSDWKAEAITLKNTVIKEKTFVNVNINTPGFGSFSGTATTPIGATEGSGAVSAKMATISFPHHVVSPSDTNNQPSKFYHASNVVPSQITCIGSGHPSQYFTTVTEITSSLKAFTLPAVSPSATKTSGNANYKAPSQIHSTLFEDYGRWRDKVTLNQDLEEVIDLLALLQWSDPPVFYSVGPKYGSIASKYAGDPIESYVEMWEGIIDNWIRKINEGDKVTLIQAKEFLSNGVSFVIEENIKTGISEGELASVYSDLCGKLYPVINWVEKQIKEADERQKEREKEYLKNVVENLTSEELAKHIDVQELVKEALILAFDKMDMQVGLKIAIPSREIPVHPLVSVSISGNVELAYIGTLSNGDALFELSGNITGTLIGGRKVAMPPAAPKKPKDQRLPHEQPATKRLPPEQRKANQEARQKAKNQLEKYKKDKAEYERKMAEHTAANKKEPTLSALGGASNRVVAHTGPCVYVTISVGAEVGTIVGVATNHSWKWTWDIARTDNNSFTLRYNPDASTYSGGGFMKYRTIGASVNASVGGGIAVQFTDTELLNFLYD